jgi:hypothetical protein
MLALSVAATLACNVGYGLPFGVGPFGTRIDHRL